MLHHHFQKCSYHKCRFQPSLSIISVLLFHILVPESGQFFLHLSSSSSVRNNDRDFKTFVVGAVKSSEELGLNGVINNKPVVQLDDDAYIVLMHGSGGSISDSSEGFYTGDDIENDDKKPLNNNARNDGHEVSRSFADSEELAGRSMTIMRHDGVEMSCSIPTSEATQSSESQFSSSSSSSSSSSLQSLLSPLEGLCFLRLEGWWTYEFCFSKHVRQFHVENVNINNEKNMEKKNENTNNDNENVDIVDDILLGAFDAKSTNQLADADSEDGEGIFYESMGEVMKTLRGSDGMNVYTAQLYSNGTACDIGTQARRTTEVRFFCNGNSASTMQNYIASVAEPSTCTYVLKFLTPFLCDHPKFKQSESSFSYIQCNPIKDDAHLRINKGIHENDNNNDDDDDNKNSDMSNNERQDFTADPDVEDEL